MEGNGWRTGFIDVVAKNQARCLLQRIANAKHMVRVTMTHIDDLADLRHVGPFPATFDNVDAFLEAFGAWTGGVRN